MISAKIVADSICNGKRITTWELEYPRFIHAELMTHRQFSRNAASSRAIPIDKTLEQVEYRPAMPEEWGVNQAGMQAKEVMEGWKKATAVWGWKKAAKAAVKSAKILQKMGLHKQIVNRVLEPFVHMKVVVTATEWKNWYYLRNHKDAQPEIRELAKLMAEKEKESQPRELKPGEWHVPYVNIGHDEDGAYPFLYDEGPLSWEEALKISASCCAQVSYRKLDESLDKATKIYDQLVTMRPVHASPFEHQATPMARTSNTFIEDWEEGTTHADKYGQRWSGNFCKWIQYRQLIDGHVVEG